MQGNNKATTKFDKDSENCIYINDNVIQVNMIQACQIQYIQHSTRDIVSNCKYEVAEMAREYLFRNYWNNCLTAMVNKYIYQIGYECNTKYEGTFSRHVLVIFYDYQYLCHQKIACFVTSIQQTIT